jgi:hypothetical protein
MRSQKRWVRCHACRKQIPAAFRRCFHCDEIQPACRVQDGAAAVPRPRQAAAGPPLLLEERIDRLCEDLAYAQRKEKAWDENQLRIAGYFLAIGSVLGAVVGGLGLGSVAEHSTIEGASGAWYVFGALLGGAAGAILGLILYAFAYVVETLLGPPSRV